MSLNSDEQYYCLIPLKGIFAQFLRETNFMNFSQAACPDFTYQPKIDRHYIYHISVMHTKSNELFDIFQTYLYILQFIIFSAENFLVTLEMLMLVYIR